MARVELQALIAVATLASFAVVAHFSSKSAAPTTVLGWPRDVFGLYNYNYGAPQVWSSWNARPQQSICSCRDSSDPVALVLFQAPEQAAPQYGPEYRMYSADSRLANRAIHRQRVSGMQPAWGNMRSQQAIAQPGLFLLHLILMLFLTSTFSPNFDLITYRMMYRCSGEGERQFIARARQVPRGWAVRDIQKWVTTENLASSLSVRGNFYEV